MTMSHLNPVPTPHANASHPRHSFSTLSTSLWPMIKYVTHLNHLSHHLTSLIQSINVIKCREFCNLLLLLCTDLKDSDIPHRTKLCESIIKAWKAYFSVLISDLQVHYSNPASSSYLLTTVKLQKAKGRISFTADLWSNKNLCSYLCITAHWLANNPQTGKTELRTTLIAFHNISGKHNGVNLVKITLQLLDRASITTNVSSFPPMILSQTDQDLKVGLWTLNNADNKGTFMEELQHLLNLCDIPFHHTNNQIMCVLFVA